jgi:soluble P-type ATPase
MLEVDIPSRGLLRLKYLVLDVNGTIALDGQLVPVVPSIESALDLLLYPRRLVATLRT